MLFSEKLVGSPMLQADLQTLFRCLGNEILLRLPDVSALPPKPTDPEPNQDQAAAQADAQDHKVDDVNLIFPPLLEMKLFREDFFDRGLGQTRLEVSMKRLWIPKTLSGCDSWRSVLCDERRFNEPLQDLDVKEVSVACILAEYCEIPFSLFTDIPESGNLLVVLNPPMSQKKTSSALIVELKYCWKSHEITLSRFQTIPSGTRLAYMADRRRLF